MIGLIIIMIPLLIYYLLIVPIIKKKIINKKIKNNLYKKIWFILLLFLPLADQLLGYIVYKTLSFTNSDIQIYETIRDEKEQRAFWFTAFKNGYPQNIINPRWEKFGIKGDIFLTKNLKEHQVVYWNECKSKKFKTYDCKKADIHIKKNNIKIYKKTSQEKDILKFFDKNGKNNKLSTTFLIDTNNSNLMPVFLNECNSSYDNLSFSNPKFKNSCKYTNDFINTNKITNVINVPKSKYAYRHEFKRKVFYFLPVSRSKQLIENVQLKKIVASKIYYHLYGGIYINSMSPYHVGNILSNHYPEKLKEKVIPNPY